MDEPPFVTIEPDAMSAAIDLVVAERADPGYDKADIDLDWLGEAEEAVTSLVGRPTMVVIWAVLTAELELGWSVPASMKAETAAELRAERCREGIIITERQVEATFGPQWRAVVRFINDCGSVTLEQARDLLAVAATGSMRPDGRTQNYRSAFGAGYSAMIYKQGSHLVLQTMIAVVHWDCVDALFPDWDEVKKTLIEPWVDVFGELPLIDRNDMVAASDGTGR